MNSAQHAVQHLLWCILVALRIAEKETPFTTETARRRFIANWLDNARKAPTFRTMNAEFTTLRQLLEKGDKKVLVDNTIAALLEHASASGQCDLFRFRSALNTLMQTGWCVVVCRHPENISAELFKRRRDRSKHALQLTRTDAAFRPTGDMTLPVTFQLLQSRTSESCEEVEIVFHSEGFQVVVADSALMLDKQRVVRTLYIGTPTMSQEEWSPLEQNIWQPEAPENEIDH